MGPILVNPHYISPVWGGSRIAEIRGLAHDESNSLGEAFDISAHEGITGTVANGEHEGMPYDEFLRSFHDEVIGDLPDEMTVQAVFMDARENLSVQVHPDDEYAKRMEGDFGKTEAWYICEAEPGATLIGGCTTSNTAELRKATAEDVLGERYGLSVPVSEGDFVLVPWRTMHALGPGILCVEISSFGNTTYRLCDWGRGRELHVEKGFGCLDTASCVSVTRLGKASEARYQSLHHAVINPIYFSDVVDVHGEWQGETNGRYRLLTCVYGTAHVSSDQGDVDLGYTRSCVIPASLGSFAISGDCRVLVSGRV